MARKAGLVVGLLGISGLIMAQPQTGVSGQPATAQAQMLPARQLDDLVAPIALYPDPLLSQVLVATTYPLEVVEAQQWLQRNGALKGQALMDAAKQQNWDASVQALVAFPDVLNTLNQDVQWTTALGNAFLAQQSDVMAAVQRMRASAQANGKLTTTPQQTVTTETQGGQTAIDIAPANPQVIYVPEYDPEYIWGPPVWGYYPPLYYGGLGYGFYPGIDIGLWFGGWGGWGWGGWGWGWGPSWFGGGVFLNGGFFNHYGFHNGFLAGGYGRGFGGRTPWQHDPSHRLGVSYPNGQLSSRYGAASMASRRAVSGASLASTRGGGAGAWNRFGSGTSSSYANRSAGMQGARGAAIQSGAARSSAGQWSHFQGTQRYSAPAQRSQSYQGMGQRYQGSAQRYSAPAQRYSSPSYGGARSYSSGGGAARSYSGGGYSGWAARSYSGGGGSRSFGGGGGHSSGGGGGHSAGGGGGHGGGRR
jgi:hypothetical protein